MDEESYEQGSRMAWLQMLQTCCRELGYDDPEASKVNWITEREGAVSALRDACSDHGDNDWDTNLHLADIIAKHLHRNLSSGDTDHPPGLKGWLLSREEDIALHIEDLGDLNGTFTAVIGRDAE